ncbi:MAG: hypothetical protein KC713_10085, partial [Candidatus Omnitrophica bacterium]|nr:hypothetical protein [Candidatus Omnitrophota bacterium]
MFDKKYLIFLCAFIVVFGFYRLHHEQSQKQLKYDVWQAAADEPVHYTLPASEHRKNDALSAEDAYISLLSLHQTKRPPGPYDWMAMHAEAGQGFEDFIKSHPLVPDETRKIIYITLLGDFDATQQSIIEQTARFIEVYFQQPVKFAEAIPLSNIPAHARRLHPQTKDPQILSSYVIEEVLIPTLPNDAFCYIAFTSSDLWPGEGWNFVFGQASIEDRVGVWSIYRNGDPKTSEEARKVCLMRTIKTGTHEIGHMFGLHHCIFY